MLTIEIPAARANDLIVKYDQSQLLRLPRPAAAIIIGNPTIADVSVQGGNLLVVTGQSYGITNIIHLAALQAAVDAAAPGAVERAGLEIAACRQAAGDKQIVRPQAAGFIST